MRVSAVQRVVAAPHQKVLFDAERRLELLVPAGDSAIPEALAIQHARTEILARPGRAGAQIGVAAGVEIGVEAGVEERPLRAASAIPIQLGL